MTTDYRALITEMAAELDRCQQLLMDDRRQRHPLADRARAALAESDGPAVPDGREPASVATQPSDEEIMGPTDEALDELFTEIDQGGEALSWRAYARAVLARWGNQPAPVPVADALIKAECALSDIAEGEPMTDEGDPLQWAERRCADTLAIIRPWMKQYGIRTSEWPPLPTHALPTPEATDD